MRASLLRVSLLAVLLLAASSASAQDQTVGLFYRGPGAAPGYTLFTPLNGTTTYLIDLDGQRVNSWPSAYEPGNSHYLLDTGHLLRASDPMNNDIFRAGGDAGLVEIFSWDGDIVWSYLYSDETHRAHHDIEPMPGSVLILAWEYRSDAESIAAGRDPSRLPDGALWPEHIIEVVPTGPNSGTIIWEWHLWDHLIQDFDPTQANFGVVADHPELLDINFAPQPGADWIHANAIDYNAELDQIVISSPFLNEFWVIDHSTTSEEASGHSGGRYGRGGDFLYRWGNPQAYRAGTADDQSLFNQHDVQWIDPGLPGAGDFLVFNNGRGRPEGPFSSVDELVPPLAPDGSYLLTPGASYGPEAPVWSLTTSPPEAFYSDFISGAQRLQNGSTLVCGGAWGVFFEASPVTGLEWAYVNPVTPQGPLRQGAPIPQAGPTSTANRVFRATRIQPDHPGLVGRDLSPKGLLERPACPADVHPIGDPDDQVDLADYLTVLAGFGTDGPGAELAEPRDLVDEFDLLVLLQSAGPCP